ncbi:unnamed protein product [Moneuplotes crassus]|uniref:Uncharacterized protein n=1 Tax=Euplotes crassus TaxID=5936 RepID=A0AAD1UB99_EUPCR|nr:unnamed protein product [Moneuplotes crassus]
MKYLGSIFSKLKGADMFSYKFTLNFKQKKNYHTFIGAGVSIIICIICILYAIFLFSAMFQRKRTSTNSGIIRTDKIQEPLNVTMNDEGIYIALSARAGNASGIDAIEEGIVKIRLAGIKFKLNRLVNSEGGIPEISSEIHKCNQTSFPYDPQISTNRLEINYPLYCFDRADLMKLVYRDFNEGDNIQFALLSDVCPGNSCTEDQKEIAESHPIEINLLVLSKYYDSSDPINPVKTYVQNDYSFYIPKGKLSFYNYDLVRNRYSISDWDSVLLGEKSGEFYDIEQGSNYFGEIQTGGTGLSILFKVSSVIRNYETSVIGFLDVFGQVGGLFEILFLFSSILVKRVTEVLYKRDINATESQIKRGDGWFSYPSQSEKAGRNKQKRKNKRKRFNDLAPLLFPTFRNQVMLREQRRQQEAIDRSLVYQEEQPVVSKLTEIQNIRKEIRLHDQLTQELDIVNISQSLGELKMYVGYLLDKDKQGNNNLHGTHSNNPNSISDNRQSKLLASVSKNPPLPHSPIKEKQSLPLRDEEEGLCNMEESKHCIQEKRPPHILRKSMFDYDRVPLSNSGYKNREA